MRTLLIKPFFYIEKHNGQLAGLEHGTLYYYSLSYDSLLSWGYENPTTKLKNDLPELLLRFPSKYGDSHTNYFYGRGLYSDRIEMLMQGTVLSETDACGMMLLPDGDTLRNVLRTRALKYISKEMQPITADYYSRRDSVPSIVPDSIDYRLENDSKVYAVETFRWYARGYRYPVFETIRSWTRQSDGNETPLFNTAFFFPPEEHTYLEEDSENLAILEENSNGDPVGEPHPWEGLTCNYYPNPVKNHLEVEIYMPHSGNVRMTLTNQAGQMIWQKSFGRWKEGIQNVRILMAPYPKGEYVLNMRFDDYVMGKIILKK